MGLVLAALMGMVGACGDSGDSPQNDIDLTPPEPLPDVADIEEDTNDASDAGSDMGDLAEDTDDQDGGDAQDMGSDGDTGPELCGGEECGPQEMCENDVCKLPASVQCNGATDKGSVAVGETITLSGDFTGDVGDGLTTKCSGDRPETPEMVYSFTVEENSLFEMTTDFPGAFDAKVEFRRSSCENPAADKTVCRDDDTGFWAAAGETVYAVVEHDSGPADSFTVDLTAKAAPCNPNTYSCNAQGNLEYCQYNGDTTSVVEYQCPGGCSNGACTGDSCSNPIVVNGSGGTYAGDIEPFTDQLDFTNASQCKISDPQPTTDGAELVFEIPIQSGETLTVDASNDSADHLIFISGSCGPDPSHFACFDETNDETLTFSPTTGSGTVYAIVDKWTRKIEPFDIRIDIE